jgi:hypothetical protein
VNDSEREQWLLNDEYLCSAYLRYRRAHPRATKLSFARWVNSRHTIWPAMHYLNIRACQADALFVSALQRSNEPDVSQVRRAIAAAIRAFGCPGCAQRVAQEFGDHPDTAVVRMRWARIMAREAFADSAPEPGLGPDACPLPVVRPRLPAEEASGSRDAGRRARTGLLAAREG